MITSSGGGGGAAGVLTGATPTAYEAAYGGVPRVPDPSQSMASAIAANSGNLSSLYNLFGGVNTFMGQQAANQLRMNLPNYDNLIGERSSLIDTYMSGELPDDVVNQLIRKAAERGIATGSPMSGNANAAYLRALGLTSLDLQQKGLSNLSTAIHDTPTAPLANPSSMFITPDAIQQAQMAANLYASAPQPGAAARAAKAAGSIGSYKPGGISSVASGGGGRSGPVYSSPEPGTYAVSSLGDGYNYTDPSRYDAWNDWYGSLPGIPGVPNTVQVQSSPFAGPYSWGAPSGTAQFGNSYFNTGLDDGIDWDFYNNDGPATPNSYFDPVLDVSINPASMGASDGYYGWSGVDLGLGF